MAAKKKAPVKRAMKAAKSRWAEPMSVDRPRNARAVLERLNGGPLTFGQLISSTRLGEEESLEIFAAKLGVSRAYLCDVEKGRRSVSVERAAEWARLLGYLETQYVALALQDAVNAAGLKYRVSVEPAARKVLRRESLSHHSAA